MALKNRSKFQPNSTPAALIQKQPSQKPGQAHTIIGDVIVALLVLTILVCSAAVSKLLFNDQLNHVDETTSAVSRATVSELQADIAEIERSFSRISRAFQNNKNMSQQLFWRLMLETNSDLEYAKHIAWAPKIKSTELHQWIAGQKATTPKLLSNQITQGIQNINPMSQYSSGDWYQNPEADIPQYLFVQYLVSPNLLLENIIGQVLNSTKTYESAIEQSIKTSDIVASPAMLNKDGSLSSLLVSPIYNGMVSPGTSKSVQREREMLTAGVLNLKIDLEKLLENRFSTGGNHSLGVSVEEIDARKNNMFLFQSASFRSKESSTVVESINFFGNTWKVIFHREPQTLSFLLPSIMAVFLGLIIIAALLIWHTNSRRFKRQLHDMLAEQKKEISKKTSLLEAVLAAAPVGIEYIDEYGMVQLQNDLSRLSTINLTAKSAIDSGAARLIKKGEDNLQHFQLQTNTDEEKQYFEIIAKEIDGTSTHGIGLVIVCNDVTARELANRKLESYIRELETINCELEEFTYSATHDLQEPLRRIASFSEIISDQIADGQLQNATEITARLVSSTTDLRHRFVQVVNQIDDRNQRRAKNDHLNFLDKSVSNQKHGQG